MKIKSTEPTIASSLLIQFAKDRKISVKEIAERTGLSYSHVVNILNGSRDITPKNEKKLCLALKLNKEEQYALKEAIFISNKDIVISTKNKRDYVLKLLYWVADPVGSTEIKASDMDNDGTVNEQDNFEPTTQDEDISTDIAADVQTEAVFPEDGVIDNDVEVKLDDSQESTTEIVGDNDQAIQDDIDTADIERSSQDTDGTENTDTANEDTIKADVDNIGNSLDELSSDWNDNSFQDQEFYNNDLENTEICDNNVSADILAENEIENLKGSETNNVSDLIENNPPEDVIDTEMDFEIPRGIDDIGLENTIIEDPYENIQNISDIIDFASEFSDDGVLPDNDAVDYGMENDNYDFEIPDDGSDVYIGDLASVDIEEIGELFI